MTMSIDLSKNYITGSYSSFILNLLCYLLHSLFWIHFQTNSLSILRFVENLHFYLICHRDASSCYLQNPNFMKTIFTSKKNSRVRPFDLLVKNRNTEKYGSKSLMALGPKIWNALTAKIKKETSFIKLKEYIKSWPGPTCKCKRCLSI